MGFRVTTLAALRPDAGKTGPGIQVGVNAHGSQRKAALGVGVFRSG